jgi:hypothetical protein
MPQTVALQRGTASLTWNGTTQHTLFTQSGGIATRVVIGGISFTSSSDGPLSIMLVVRLAGSASNTVTVAFKGTSTRRNPTAIDFVPGVSPNSSAQRPSTVETTSGQTVLAYTSANNQLSGSSSYNIQSVSATGADSATDTGSTSFNYEYCPLQFWIGPSDIVSVKVFNYNASGATGTVAFNFTTITES